MNLYRRYLITLALIWMGCSILFCFAYMLVLAPQKRSKARLEKQLAEKKQMYETVREASQEQARVRLAEQIERLQNELSDFTADLEDSANLIFDISQFASGRKVDSFSVRSKDGSSGSPMPNCKCISENRLDVSFGAADFNQFATFLNALERHQPIIFVDKFKIIRSTQDKSGHQVNMELAVFVRKQQLGSG